LLCSMAPLGKMLRAATSHRLNIASTKVPKAVLTNKKCLAIVNKLSDTCLSGLPRKSQELAKKLRQGLIAKGKRRLEAEKGTFLLGKLLREVNTGLQNVVEEARAEVDGADAERESRTSAAAAAETELAQSKESVIVQSRAVKEALKGIDETKAAIAEVKSTRQSHEVQSRKGLCRKRQLEEVEKQTYEPLKFAAAEGPDGNKRLSVLRRTGKAFNFQNELLSIAPVILRKPLDSRHTFEDLVVRQLASEFNKNVSAISAEIKNSEEAIQQSEQQFQAAEAELAKTRSAHKKATRNLAFAEAAVVKATQAFAEAKAQVRKLPADLKKSAKSLANAEVRLDKFERGPQAAFDAAIQKQFPAALASAAAAPTAKDVDASSNATLVLGA